MKKCIYNGKIIKEGQVVTGEAILFDTKILGFITGEEVTALEDEIEKIDAKGHYISPGFIDPHIHGINGDDASDGDQEAIQRISSHITRYGVTSYLPTTMTMSKQAIHQAIEAIRIAQASNTKGAQILGVHMEGPFLNINKKGAQPGEHIKPPSMATINQYKDIVSLMTVAPESAGAKAFIKEVKASTTIRLSMGHTDATFEEAMAGIECGITCATHTFNAMLPLHHRNPGAVGAALASDIYCELIADGVHVHPGIFGLMLKAKGMDKVILITDCMRAGDLEDGEYTLGGQKVFVKDGKPTLEDGTIAGSTLVMNQAVKNFYQASAMPIDDVIKLATLNPAKFLGIDDQKGSLALGKDADIIVFDEKIDIKATIVNGKICYQA